MNENQNGRGPILSLFAGCGGLDLGFEQAGYEVGLAYDLRPAAIRSHNHNRERMSGHVRDITALTIGQMDEDFGATFSPRGVIGGPPCQSFSRGNVSKKVDDPRTGLVRQFFTLALKLHRTRAPLDFIVMENVPEVARAQDGRLLELEIRRLKRYGFDVWSQIYNAADYGVAQSRRRLILVAINRTQSNALWEAPPKTMVRRTVKDAIFGLRPPVRFCDAATSTVFPEHPNHWCMTPRSEKFRDGSLQPGRSRGRSFKTLNWDRPSYTVSYGHREVHVHPDCERRLSVFEAMRLQGFPDEFVLKGTMSDQFSQVSEAVPPPLARAIAQSVMGAFRSSNSAKAAA